MKVAGAPLHVHSSFAVLLAVAAWNTLDGMRTWEFVAFPTVPSAQATSFAQEYAYKMDHAMVTAPSLAWILAGTLGTALVYALSILVHEIGHVMAARRYDVEVTSVLLHGLGGLVEHHDDERMTARSLAAIAGAGPLATAALALVSGGALLALGWPLTELADADTGAVLAATYVLRALFVVNAALLVFNLLPLRALDGGKLLMAARMWRGRH